MKARLLELDGIGNVVLGLALVIIPREVSQFLGLAPTGGTLYAVVLGAVFVGIGVALFVHRFRPSAGGLGLAGATSINLVFGVALAGWLVFGEVNLLARGALILWVSVVLLFGISLVEILAMGRGRAPGK
jgi:hypothetical protein